MCHVAPMTVISITTTAVEDVFFYMVRMGRFACRGRLWQRVTALPSDGLQGAPPAKAAQRGRRAGSWQGNETCARPWR